MKGKQITVKLAQITELKSFTISEATFLEEFLDSQGFEYDSSVRVNGVVKPKSYKLRSDDIITVIGEVSGGI